MNERDKYILWMMLSLIYGHVLGGGWEVFWSILAMFWAALYWIDVWTDHH